MAAPTPQDLSTPEASVETFLRAWQNDDPDLQWDCLLKVDAEGRVIEHHFTDAIVERWDRDEFRKQFPDLKEQFFDRYELRRMRSQRFSADKVRVHYAARRKDSLLRSLPFWLSKSAWIARAASARLGLDPWYDALAYFDTAPKNDAWRISDWRYYKY